jgi:formate dehydrogenase
MAGDNQPIGAAVAELIAKMKRGAYLVNTARGKICDREAVVRALE